MKPVLFTLVVFTFLADSALADSLTIMQDRARALANQGSKYGQENTASPSAPAPAPQTAPPPASPPPLTPAQQTILRIQTDVAAIKTNSVVSAEQKQQLAQDLMSISLGANKPSADSLAKLADELSAALTEKKLWPAQQKRLVQDVCTLLNSANLPGTQKQAIIEDVQNLLESSTGANIHAGTATEELKTIVAEVAKPATK